MSDQPAVYVPPATVCDPQPEVYYTIQGAFQLLTFEKQKHVLPIVAQIIAKVLQPYCVIEGYTGLVRVLMPASVANDNYEMYVYFPRAVESTDIYGQIIPVPTPQYALGAPALAELLNGILTPGTALYAKILAAINTQLVDPLTEIALVCPFAYLDEDAPTEPVDEDTCTKPCARRLPPPRRPACTRIVNGQVVYF